MDIKLALKQWWCNHKDAHQQYGYGYMTGLGLGTYTYNECSHCGLFLKLTSFEKDLADENLKKELSNLYSHHGQGD